MAAADAAPGGAPPGPQSMIQQTIMLVLIVGIGMYFLVLRPQKRDQDKRKALLENLKKGDKIVTIGGIHGWVAEVDKSGKTLTIRVDTKTNLKINRSAVSAIETREGGEEEGGEKLKSE